MTYRPVGADALLLRNLLIWGLGGVIFPFMGIKAIDLVLSVILGNVPELNGTLEERFPVSVPKP